MSLRSGSFASRNDGKHFEELLNAVTGVKNELEKVLVTTRTTLVEFTSLETRSRQNGEALANLLLEIQGVRSHDGVEEKLTGLAQLDMLQQLSKLKTLDQIEQKVERMNDRINSTISSQSQVLARIEQSNEQRGNIDSIRKVLDDVSTSLARLCENTAQNATSSAIQSVEERMQKFAKILDNTNDVLANAVEQLAGLKAQGKATSQRSDFEVKAVEKLDKLDQLDQLQKLVYLDELSKLSSLESLSKLDRLSNLDSMQNLSKLDKLDRFEDHKAQLEKLNQLESINELSLQSLAKLNHLAESNDLQRLKELDQLSNLQSLQKLDQLSQLTGLQELKQLSKLAKLDDLNALSSLTHLSDLKNLSKLDQLTGLDELQQLRQLQGLEQLEQLTKLNRLSELAQLSQLSQLSKLSQLDTLSDSIELAVKDIQEKDQSGLNSIKQQLTELTGLLSEGRHPTGEKQALEDEISMLRKEKEQLTVSVSKLKGEIKAGVGRMEEIEARWTLLRDDLNNVPSYSEQASSHAGNANSDDSEPEQIVVSRKKQRFAADVEEPQIVLPKRAKFRSISLRPVDKDGH